MCATCYIGRHDTHHVLIRWQIHPDWGDSWPWEHARFRSTSRDGGNAQRVHEQGSAHTYNPLWHTESGARHMHDATNADQPHRHEAGSTWV